MSKELEALERIETFLKENCKHYKQDIGYIEQALIKSQKQEELLDILKKALSNIHIGIAKDSNDGVCCVIGLYNPEVDKMYMLFESHNSEIVNKAEQLKEWFNKDKSE